MNISQRFLQINNSKLGQNLLTNKCAHPRIFNGTICRCNECVNCLSAIRQEWAFRITEEMKSPRCVHAFGCTLTYDNLHLPVVIVENGKLVVNSQHRWGMPDGEKVNSYTGISPFLNKRDIQLYCKTFCELVKKKYDNKFKVRYYFVGEYGENQLRPHYHGIWFLYDMNSNYVADFTEDVKQLKYDSLRQTIEQMALDHWKYCRRFQNWSEKKQCYQWCGKTIETIKDGSYGLYLGKYINKITLSAKAIASKEFPEFRISSQKSIWVDHDTAEVVEFPPLGGNFIDKNFDKLKEQYAFALANNQSYNVTYTENGYVKYVPRTLQRYFHTLIDKIPFYKVCEMHSLQNSLPNNSVWEKVYRSYKSRKIGEFSFFKSQTNDRYVFKTRVYNYCDMYKYRILNSVRNKLNYFKSVIGDSEIINDDVYYYDNLTGTPYFDEVSRETSFATLYSKKITDLEYKTYQSLKSKKLLKVFNVYNPNQIKLLSLKTLEDWEHLTKDEFGKMGKSAIFVTELQNYIKWLGNLPFMPCACVPF